ncbi:MAG: glycosyltransferase family 4 protein [Chloroflexia bacterium]|nr:glycosyltransferase family 4 protein [Bacteroidales bacterium]NJO89892.1 glycosyltransferase family 4 protein [Chloroflexia bacterium]
MVNKYRNACALLIPLRDTLQDNARFPQKIAEYCAAKRPIISTRIGEVAYYFDDNSAILAERYNINDFSEKLVYVIQNPEKCEQIAINSYEIGKKYFDYKSYALPLKEFMFHQIIY